MKFEYHHSKRQSLPADVPKLGHSRERERGIVSDMPRRHLQCLQNRFASGELRGRRRSVALFILWFAGLLIVFSTPGLRSQDGPDNWYRSVRETPFDRATFPFILAPDSKTKTAAYISFPVEHVTGHVFRADMKMLAERGNPDVIILEKNRAENVMREPHIALTLQREKTSEPSGFCVTTRILSTNEVSVIPFDCNFSGWGSPPPERFYLTIHVPYWVGRVTIVDVKLTGYRFIEKEIADKREEDAIRGWIKQLGAENFQERQAAEQQLLEMGEKAIPLLKEAKLDRDPERRERVRTTLEVLEKKQCERSPPIHIK